MQTKIRFSVIALSAWLLGGCATWLMHDKVDQIPEQKEMYSQETLRYMGLDKDGQLIMVTDRHHLALSPNESTLRQHQAKIFAKMNRWAQQYP